MIKRLQIWNFLSHKKTEIDFSPGVNIIVGPTDSGKSAIIKALKWTIQNRPLGDSVKSYWIKGGEATATKIHFEEGSILRTRGDKENSYTINEEGRLITFNAIKGDVPEEVQKLINLEDVNLQTQFAPHFLLTQSSGEVAQYFNKVAHLDKIDTASQNIRKWTKDIQQNIQYQEETLRTLEENLEQYKDLEEIERRVTEIEETEHKIDLVAKEFIALDEICEELKKIDSEVEGYSFLLELEGLVNDIIKIGGEKKEMSNKLEELGELVYSIGVANREIIRIAQDIKQLEESFHKELGKGKVCPLCNSVLE